MEVDHPPVQLHQEVVFMLTTDTVLCDYICVVNITCCTGTLVYSWFCLNNLFFFQLSGPVIISNGGDVINGSIVNNFDADTLTLTCSSDHMLDVVRWIMITSTGTVERQFTSTSNFSSTLTFTYPSDDFSLQLRCVSNNVIYRDVLIIKGNTQ